MTYRDSYYAVKAEIPVTPDALGQRTGIALLGAAAGDATEAVLIARERLGNPASQDRVSKAGISARELIPPLLRPRPTVGTGTFGVRLHVGPVPVQDRLYVMPKAQRSAAMHYLLQGYTVSLFRDKDQPLVQVRYLNDEALAEAGPSPEGAEN